nr:reverse transcriptase domain-containing protein [Tanacetum cinerariifolium]
MTKDQVQIPSPQSTAHVQPPVTQFETPVFEPIVAPVSAPMPNLKPSIPYPSRRDNERRREQANEQIEKFYEIFKDMSFEIRFTGALILMPKFASTLKALIGNKEKLSKMARTPINEHCSAVILNKLPKKLGDPGKFLIPCEFPGMDECLALADLGASISLMPLFVWKELALPELTSTCMTLELVDRSVFKPIGIAKDVSVKTGRALIDVHKGELTLRIRNEAIIYNLEQTSRYSANYDQMTANKVDVTDEAYEEYFQEVLGFSEVTASDDKLPVIIAKELGDEEKATLIKVLKSHKRAIAWKLSDIQEKTTFTCPYGTLAYRRMPFGLCNAPGTFQRCMLAIFHDMAEKTMEVFMDDFSVFGNSFETCLSRLDKMLQRCEDTKLCINWEKNHFVVKEGIVLGHKISRNGIEVDKAKVDIITKLPHPTSVKGVRSFIGHAGFYRRFIKDFSKISRPMTHLLEKDTPFIFSEDCIKAFQTLKQKLTEAPILIAPNWNCHLNFCATQAISP